MIHFEQLVSLVRIHGMNLFLEKARRLDLFLYILILDLISGMSFPINPFTVFLRNLTFHKTHMWPKLLVCMEILTLV